MHSCPEYQIGCLGATRLHRLSEPLRMYGSGASKPTFFAMVNPVLNYSYGLSRTFLNTDTFRVDADFRYAVTSRITIFIAMYEAIRSIYTHFAGFQPEKFLKRLRRRAIKIDTNSRILTARTRGNYKLYSMQMPKVVTAMVSPLKLVRCVLSAPGDWCGVGHTAVVVLSPRIVFRTPS